MKKILVPFDFSESAFNSLLYARELYKDIHVNFYVLTVNSIISNTYFNDDFNDEIITALVDESKDDLDEMLADFSTKIKNSKHSFHSTSSPKPLTVALNTYIKSLQVDIVIMGSKGPKSSFDVFIGNKVLKVIKTIDNCPLIIVPEKYLFRVPEQIVFSTNFKREFNLDELESLIELLKISNSKLKVVQVMDEEYLNAVQKENKEKLKNLFSGLDYFFIKINVEDSESQAIRNFIEQTKSDAISFVNHKQNFFHKLTDEDVIKKVSFNSPVPIFILPEFN